MTMIHFAKTHACGNDFLIVESPLHDTEKLRAQAIQLCSRNTSVGADGVEYLEMTGERSGRIRLFNADGSIAEISGNGTRCVAAYVAHKKHLAAADTVMLQTDAGERTSHIVNAEGHHFQMKAEMGVPTVQHQTVKLEDGSIVHGVNVSTGNPHFVLFVNDESFTLQGKSWQELGREICFHRDFPEQTNVEFVHQRSDREIAIRIFERGVGPTSSSGTGTCATATATMAKRAAAAHLLVHAPGGAQTVDWQGDGTQLLLTGPAELIAYGEAFVD